MASTYSNLKIQLMTTGENSTTWGDVTNINLGTALEEAIAGSADVTFASANVTLTLTDTNTSQTARNMRLRCIGVTGGSTRSLILPNIEKAYIIQNDCADMIIARTLSGGSVSIPAGKITWVYNNSIDVVDALDHLASLTLDTALTVDSGGTGSNTASGARTNLGLGSIATQNANAVAITGGSITNITDLAIADGGTGASTAADARTNLGATTVGGNVFTLVNPSAVTFPRFNADNTVSALDAATFRTAIGAGTSSTTGTVTSVAGAGTVNGLTLTGTVTSSGSLTLGGTLSGVSLTTQVSGTLPVANGGTNATDAAGARSSLGAAASGTNTDITTMNPASGLQVGSPTGGAKGVGTINATGLFVNGVAVGTSSGTVSSVSGTGTVNGLTLTGTVTSSGSLTLGGTLSGVSLTTQVSGTLPIANGGTNATSAAAALTSLGAYPATNPNGYTANTGTVTSVSGTGSANGLSISGTVTTSGNITLSGSVTSVATGATIDGVVIGYRNIPRSTTSGTATIADVGKVIAVSAGITIPNSTFAAGDAVSIYNNSASPVTITAGVTTLRQAGTANTGNRTLAAYGMATVWFNSATEAIISGAGVS